MVDLHVLGRELTVAPKKGNYKGRSAIRTIQAQKSRCPFPGVIRAIESWSIVALTSADDPGFHCEQSFGSFTPLAAIDPEHTVEALEGRRCSQPPVTRKRPFNFQRCYSCLTGSFEGSCLLYTSPSPRD